MNEDILTAEDLASVTGAGDSPTDRQVVTPQTQCTRGLLSPYIAVSVDTTTGQSTEYDPPRRCGECEYMSCESGVDYCNYSQ